MYPRELKPSLKIKFRATIQINPQMVAFNELLELVSIGSQERWAWTHHDFWLLYEKLQHDKEQGTENVPIEWQENNNLIP